MAERIMATKSGLTSRPPTASSMNWWMILRRSASESLVSLCMSLISSGLDPRLATARRAARRSRKVRICTSSASAWTPATSAIETSWSSTRPMVARSTSSSRNVRIRSRRASASRPYRRYPPGLRSAGGSTPQSE